MMTATQRPALEVRNLSTHLTSRSGVVRAVDDVSFSVASGETLGLVGESGSGKSMTCLSLLRLVPKRTGSIVGGSIILDGDDLMTKSETEMTAIRGQRIAMILQDPMSSLNPVFSIGMQVGESVTLHAGLHGAARDARSVELLGSVGISAPESRLRAYPHQLSGGMRQRVVGAMAIVAPPAVLIADEPTTSLDVTIQAQYLRLLKDLQQKHGLAMILVTHDLGIVVRMCHRVAVMYAGRIVEIGPMRRIWSAPAHPYTRALLDSIPRLGSRGSGLAVIAGQPPDGAALPSGCAFHPRCPKATERCRMESPPEVEVVPGHSARCWYAVPSAHHMVANG